MKAELLVDQPKTRTTPGARTGFPRLWAFAAEYLVALPLGALIALVWANTSPERYYRVADSLAFLVNDVLMVAFFALITKEVVEATAPGGILHPWRRAALPVLASIGITAVPVALFAILVRLFEEPMLVRGWTTVLAVDVALGYFIARLVFGKHPAIAFYLLLAISANGLGFLALALVDPIHEVRLAAAAPLMLAAIGSALAMRRARLKRLWPYVAVGGGLSWAALFFGGFHPALALLPIVPFLPHAARDRGFFVDAPGKANDALSRLELWCRHPAQAALLLFGLVNAGVPFRALEAGVWSLPLAALIGKPLGLLAGVTLGIGLGLHLPRRVHWNDLTVLGFISAAGFTMALFFATATLGAGQMLAELKMGAVLSAGAGLAAFGVARVLRAGKFGD